MAFCVPIASMVTIAPSIASMSRSSGMAVISLPLASTARAASTSPASCAKAETTCKAPAPLLSCFVPRRVLPSIATTPETFAWRLATHDEKARSSAFGSSARRTRRKVCAIAKRQKTAQPGKLPLAEHRDLVEILHPAQQPDQHRQQHLV